jgi:hypothetical protein
MLRGGHVDVAVVFRYEQDGTVIGPPLDEEVGTRSTLLLREPVHLVTSQATAAGSGRPVGGPGQAAGGTGQAAGGGVEQPGSQSGLAAYAGHRWIAGCERCRAHLLWQCELAGFTPQIAFTTDDVMVAQALAAAGLGVALLPDLALRAVRHRGIHTTPLPGAHREILALTYGEPPDPSAVEHLLTALSQASPESSLPRSA